MKLTRRPFLRRSEKLLLLVFLLGVMEGTVRKWLLPESAAKLGYVAYFSKDLALLALCLVTPGSRTGAATRQFKRFLVPGISLVIVGAWLSSLQGLDSAGAVLSVRSLVLMPLLAYLAVSRLGDADATRVARGIALLTSIPALVGLLQFNLPPTHILNKYVGVGIPITYSGWVRATGTFSFISGMASMSLLGVWAGLFLGTQARARGRDRWIGLGAVLAGLVCAATAISRSGAFLSAGLILATVLLGSLNKRFLIALVVLVAFLADVGLNDDDTGETSAMMPTAATLTSTVMQRHMESDSVLERTGGSLEQVSSALRDSPLGTGFGVAQVGGVAVRSGEHQLTTYESELARVVLETGWLGLAGMIWVRLGVVIALFSAWRRLPAGHGRTGVLVSALAIAVFLTRNTAFDHVALGFAWPLIALSLARADQQLRATAAASTGWRKAG